MISIFRQEEYSFSRKMKCEIATFLLKLHLDDKILKSVIVLILNCIILSWNELTRFQRTTQTLPID